MLLLICKYEEGDIYTMDDWAPVKDFSKYEINADGVIRNVHTKKVISQRYISKKTLVCTLFDDNGLRNQVKVKELLKFSFPQAEEELEEEWVPIANFENYLVSPNGKVKNSITNRVFDPQKPNNGYYSITLKGKDNKFHSFLIHRLVAQAFIPNPNNLPFVNHIDENKTNNHVSNLEWVSEVENARHGTSPQRVSLSHLKPVNEYDENGKYLRTWKGYKYIQLIYKIHINSKMQNGYCCGHIFKPYDNNIHDLLPEELPNHKPKKAFDKEELFIPQEYLYTFEKEITVNEIFKKYKTIGKVPPIKQRKKDFEIVFRKIEDLQRALSKQK